MEMDEIHRCTELECRVYHILLQLSPLLSLLQSKTLKAQDRPPLRSVGPAYYGV
jgi:hypothetical protein